MNVSLLSQASEQHRKLASLFRSYFPTPKTIFPSALTSAALFKCNCPPASLQEKKKKKTKNNPLTLERQSRCWERGIDAAQELAELRGASERTDESHYSFVLAQREVNKMCGFMSSGEKLSG